MFRADRQTNMIKLTAVFRNLANAPKMNDTSIKGVTNYVRHIKQSVTDKLSVVLNI